jgi:hypothetical protein
MPSLDKGGALLAALALLAPAAAQANVYLFRVDCKGETYVAQWSSGPVDPGRDRFRLATGNANLDCAIYDFNPRTDRDLPRRWCSGEDGPLRGFPPLLIPLGLAQCR